MSRKTSTTRYLVVELFVAALLLYTWGAHLNAASAQPTLADVVQQTAQEATAGDETSPEEEVPFDDLGRATPRTTVQGFLDAVAARDFERAAEYLHLRNLPRRVIELGGPELAAQLRTVLERTLWIDLATISNKPEGRKKDGLDVNLERIGRIETAAGEDIDVLLQRLRSDGVQIWKFAPQTVRKVPELYEEFGYGILERYLPSFFFNVEIAFIPLVEWVGLAAVAAAAFILAYLLTGVFIFFLRRRESAVGSLVSQFVSGPLRLVVGVGLFSFGTSFFHLTVLARTVLKGAESALLVLALAWTVLRLVDVLGANLIQRLVTRGETNAISLIPPARKVTKVLVIAFALIAMLGAFGFNVTALLAGVGVGGIAIALAAQKTIENMFGGLTLFANRPVRVGEFCRFGDRVGTVEEIGLYSTRVRTLDRTLITIPNAQFASLQLENFTSRDKIWYHPTIGLRYETTPEQIRYILVEVRKMLYSHPKVASDSARIRFTSFGAYSLDFEIFSYVTVTDFGEFLEVAEDLNLRIMDIVAEAGSSFAFPSQTTYVESGTGLDSEAARRAESAVSEWRQRRELYLPRFPQETIAELNGRLDYPPTGSPFATDSPGGAGRDHSSKK